MIRLGYLSVNNNYNPDDCNLKSLSHINLAFAKVNDCKGTVSFEVEDEGKLLQYRKDNPLQKICLSIGGWEASYFSEAVSCKQNRANFISSTIQIILQYDLDGVDLDWEYPTLNVGEISSSPDDRDNFTLLMKEIKYETEKLKEHTKKDYLLTYAAGAGQYLIDCIDQEEMAQICDFVNIMTYDMGGSFGTAGHHASLFRSELCDEEGGAYNIELYHKAGFEYNQLVIGAAFYGRGGTDVAGIGKPIRGQEGLSFGYHQVMDLVKQGRTKYYVDEQAKAAYTYDGFTFISLENEDSIMAKIDYVIEKGLAGIMFWEYSTDQTGILLDILVNYRTNEYK